MEEDDMDYYEVLGLPYNATDQDIKQAYHKLARQHHPDRATVNPLSADASKFNRIQTAWKTLSEPESRNSYDLFINARIQSYRTAFNTAEAVELQEFENDEAGVWHKTCRCGESFQVTEEDFTSPALLIPCTGCSLFVKLANPSLPT